MYVGIFSVTIYPSIPSSTSTPTPAISFDFKYVNSLFLKMYGYLENCNMYVSKPELFGVTF